MLAAAPQPTKESKSKWPQVARELARSLLRTEQLAKFTGGIEITRQTDTFDTLGRAERPLAPARAGVRESVADALVKRRRTNARQLVRRERNRRLFHGIPARPRVRLDAAQRAAAAAGTRRSFDVAARTENTRTYMPTLEKQGKDRTLLILKHESSPLHETRLLIDTARHVVLSIESRYKDKTTGTTKFEDFVEVAGSWSAQRIETIGEDGKRQSLTTQAIKTVAAKEFDQQREQRTGAAGRRCNCCICHCPASRRQRRRWRAGRRISTNASRY